MLKCLLQLCHIWALTNKDRNNCKWRAIDNCRKEEICWTETNFLLWLFALLCHVLIFSPCFTDEVSGQECWFFLPVFCKICPWFNMVHILSFPDHLDSVYLPFFWVFKEKVTPLICHISKRFIILNQWFLLWSGTNSNSITQELTGNANSQALSQKHWVRNSGGGNQQSALILPMILMHSKV